MKKKEMPPKPTTSPIKKPSQDSPDLSAVKEQILREASGKLSELLDKYQLRIAVATIIMDNKIEHQIQLAFRN